MSLLPFNIFMDGCMREVKAKVGNVGVRLNCTAFKLRSALYHCCSFYRMKTVTLSGQQKMIPCLTNPVVL